MDLSVGSRSPSIDLPPSSLFWVERRELRLSYPVLSMQNRAHANRLELNCIQLVREPTATSNNTSTAIASCFSKLLFKRTVACLTQRWMHNSVFLSVDIHWSHRHDSRFR